MQQVELQRQTAELADNRVSRYYARRKDQSGDAGLSQRSSSATGQGRGRGGRPANGPAAQPGPAGGDGRFTGDLDGGWKQTGTQSRDGYIVTFGGVVAAGGTTLGVDIAPGYIAGGTFSLPMTLPEGEVRLDFARRPSGDAVVTVWAVRESLLNRLYGTGGVLAGLLGLLVIVWAVRRRAGKIAPVTAKRAAAYLVLALLLMALFAGPGLLIALALAAVVEIYARAVRRPRAA